MVLSLRSRSGTKSTAREAESSDTVTVSVDSIVTGQVNRFPIRDRRDVLLLGAGHVITAQVKRRLRVRNLAGVKMHSEDAQRMTARPSRPTRSEPKGELVTATGRRLRIDAAVSNLRLPSNAGPPLVDRMVDHGATRYDEAHRERVGRRLGMVVDGLGEMIDSAVHVGDVNGTGVVNASAALLGDLLADRDAMLTLPMDEADRTDLARHCVAMSTLGMAIATEMGLNEQNVHRVGIAGLLHDWGMARVPVSIRRKPGQLTVAEMLEIEKHPAYAVDIVRRATGLPPTVSLVVHQVHERVDGRGYPRGRTGENIHLFARILAVADRFVALRSPRPYREALGPYAAMTTLLEDHAGKSIDPEILRTLLYVVSLFPVGSTVELSNGTRARVLRAGQDRFDAPVVEIIQDAAGRSLDPGSGPVIDLASSELTVVRTLPDVGTHDHEHSAPVESPLQDEPVDAEIG